MRAGCHTPHPQLPKKQKCMGLMQQGKTLPMDRGLAGDGEQGGVITRRKARLALTYVGIWECSDSGSLVGCVSSTFTVFSQMQHPMIGYTQTKSCISTRGAKRANIYRIALRYDATSQCLCYQWIWWIRNMQKQKLSNWLLP